MQQSPLENHGRSANRVALLGILFALAVVLSLIESALPPIVPVPGVKLGLANIAVMYCAVSLGARHAFLLAALKALFAAIARGAVAAALSLSGGALSVLVMLALVHLLKSDNILAISVFGAVAHNLGQLLAAGAIMGIWAMFPYYLPILAAAGIGMGLITGFVFKALQPFLLHNS